MPFAMAVPAVMAGAAAIGGAAAGGAFNNLKMPGGLNPFQGSGSSASSAPQPTALNINTPGYGLATSVGANGQLQTSLNTGGSFGQDAYKANFPLFLSQFGDFSNQAGQAGTGFLSDIGYGSTAPNAQTPYLSPLTAIENARSAAMSDLQDSLARRGVLGSSFGSDALTRQNMAYDQLKSQAQLQIAGSAMQAKLTALQQQAQYTQQQEQVITTALDKEYRDWAAANGVTTNFAALTGNLSAFDQKLAADQAAGLGSFLAGGLGMTNGGLGNMLGTSGLTGSGSGGGLLGNLGSLFSNGAGTGAGLSASELSTLGATAVSDI